MIDNDARNEMEKAFRERRHHKVIQIIKLYMKVAKPEVISELASLFGHMIKLDVKYFMEHIYPSWQELLEKLDPYESLMIDKQMVERFSLPPGDHILAESYVRVEENFGKIKRGKVFVLPDRIIASGCKNVTPKGYAAMGAGGVGYAITLTERIYNAIANRFGNGYRSKYGYAYPIRGSTIKYSDQSAVALTNEMEYRDDGGKLKPVRLELRIIPLPFEGPAKNELEFFQRAPSNDKNNSAGAADKVLDMIVKLVQEDAIHPVPIIPYTDPDSPKPSASTISGDRNCIKCAVKLDGVGSIFSLCDGCLALLGEDEQVLYLLAQKRYPRRDKEIAPQLIRLIDNRKGEPATGLMDFIFLAGTRFGDGSKTEESFVSISETAITIGLIEPIIIPFGNVTSIAVGKKKNELIITTRSAPGSILLKVTDLMLKPEIINRRLLLHVKSNAART